MNFDHLMRWIASSLGGRVDVETRVEGSTSLASKDSAEKEYRFSKRVFSLCQLVVETFLLKKYNAAYLISLNSKRTTIMVKDIELVNYILKEGTLSNRPIW